MPTCDPASRTETKWYFALLCFAVLDFAPKSNSVGGGVGGGRVKCFTPAKWNSVLEFCSPKMEFSFGVKQNCDLL